MSLPKQGARVFLKGQVVGVNNHSNPALHHVRVQLKDGQCIATHPENVLIEEEVEAAIIPDAPETTAHSKPPETTARRGIRGRN